MPAPLGVQILAAVSTSARVLEKLSPAKDALYVQSLEDGLGRMTHVGWNGTTSEVPLPVNGAVSELSTEPDANGVIRAFGAPFITFVARARKSPPGVLAYRTVLPAHLRAAVEASNAELAALDEKLRATSVIATVKASGENPR